MLTGFILGASMGFALSMAIGLLWVGNRMKG